jgi:putative heme transporter
MSRTSAMPSKRHITAALAVTSLAVAAAGKGLVSLASKADLVDSVRDIDRAHAMILAAAAALNLLTYWVVLAVALPGLGVRRAATIHLPSTALANSLPGGGAAGTGLSFAILRRWGYSSSEVAAATVASSLWNTMTKATMVMVAVGALSMSHRVDGHLRTLALGGIGSSVMVVAAAVVVLSARKTTATIADRSARVFSAVLSRMGRRPVHGWALALDHVRQTFFGVARRRGCALTAATLASHGALSLVFLASVRSVGISSKAMPTLLLLSVFAVGRVASLVPSTPGGVGLVELTFTVLLTAAGGDGGRTVAAVLVYRAATYLVPTILGGFALLAWSVVGGRALFRRQGEPAVDDADVPLVVDLDGTLFPVTSRSLMFGRLLWAGPRAVAAYRRTTSQGRGASKRFLWEEAGLDIGSAPVRRSLLRWLDEEHRRGRPIYLASGAPNDLVSMVVEHFPIFTGGWGSTDERRLVGAAKAELLQERFGPTGFDYVGDSVEDLAVWPVARRAVLCAPTRRVARQARNAATIGRVFERRFGESLCLSLLTALSWLRQCPRHHGLPATSHVLSSAAARA